MEGKSITRISLAIGLAGIVIFGAACGPSAYYSRGDEDRNVYYQRAKRAVEARDYREAVGLYQKALLVNPSLANAHMEIGLLYDDKLNDPVSAIYHYRQYLALCKDCDKKQIVEDFIERAKLSFAATLPQSPINTTADSTRFQNENANLVQQNTLLQARVAELEQQVASRPRATPPAPAPVVTPPPAPVVRATPPPPPPAPVVVAQVETPRPPPVPVAPPEPASRGRTHTVQKNDTLQSLALQYYGTRSAWDRIFSANREQMANRNELRVGQRLVIP